VAVEAVVKRIGGSVFLRIRPESAKDLGLEEGQEVMLEVRRKSWTVGDMLRFFEEFKPPADWKPDPKWKFDRRELWGED
jgi:antitoxin component of MazEF toxin-antitoxin module